MEGLEKFRHYVGKILVYTIHPDVRSYAIQGELGEGKVGWAIRFFVFDVEIKPTKLGTIIELRDRLDQITM